MSFKWHSDYQPAGDQPQAIEALVKGFQEGNQCQTLLGIMGPGKPLSGQLYGEFTEFFPENAVEYFVS